MFHPAGDQIQAAVAGTVFTFTVPPGCVTGAVVRVAVPRTELFPAQPPPLCPAGHKLVASTTGSGKCDGCSDRIIAGQRPACLACDYWLCHGCAFASQGANGAQLRTILKPGVGPIVSPRSLNRSITFPQFPDPAASYSANYATKICGRSVARSVARGGLARAYSDMIVHCPLTCLVLFLIPTIVLGVLALVKPMTFDVGVDAFQVQQSHFSQQRQNALKNAGHAESAVRTNGLDSDAPDFWNDDGTPDAAHGGSGRRRRRQQDLTPSDMWADPSDEPAADDGYSRSLAELTDAELYDREDADVMGRLELIFLRNDRDNIITRESVEQVRAIERAIESVPGYNYYCVLGSRIYGNRRCAPMNSATSYFYPSVGENQLVYDGQGSSIVDFDGTIAALQQFEAAQWFFGEAFDHTGESLLLRSEVDFAHEQIATDDSRLKYQAWLADTLLPVLGLLPHADQIKVVYGGDDITQYLVMKSLWSDLDYAAFSFGLVLIYTTVYLRSVFLGIVSLLMIVLSFPLALFFNSLHADSITLGVLNILSVYVILGIGVDDVYVFCNAFHAPRPHIEIAELEDRFHVALMRSSKAMFLTSFTTAVAFLANLIASIPVIISFAELMATLVGE